MSHVKQLWAPLSLQREESVRISGQQALAFVDAFLGFGAGAGSNPSGGLLADQNIVAQLLRLQAGLREKVHIQQQSQQENSQETTLKSEKSSSKKRKREKKERELAELVTQGSPAVDETAPVASNGEEPTKKRKKTKQ